MKKFLCVSILTIVISFSSVRAWDICGCGLNNYYIGILPQFNHKFFGIRYNLSSFDTHLTNDPTQFSKDVYQTLELWSGWNIGSKLQMLASIPYSFNHQNSDDGVTNRQGMGDIILLANYKIFDFRSVNGNNKTISQQLWLGGGIKLPTGNLISIKMIPMWLLLQTDNWDPGVQIIC